MAEKYIRQNRNSYSIVKKSKTYAKIDDLDDAIFIRDFLIEHNWNLDKVPKTIRNDVHYIVLAVVDEKIHLLAKCKSQPDDETIEKLTKQIIRNPNNSRYGLNITRIFDTFVIKKQIAGDDYIFGYYDNVEDAQFVRNFLLDNNWDINRFGDVEFDDEADNYKVVSVIEDRVYILDSFDLKDDIGLDNVYESFLAKISKHKYGFSNYPHLDLLKDMIPELEERFKVSTKDDVWSFEGISDDNSVLNHVIFNLTPFQKSVYDVIDEESSVEDIEKSLSRFKSKNFNKKILKNIDELMELDLVEKTSGGNYSRRE